MAKFKKGDKVRIKTWAEMASEYGLANNGHSILCNARFTDAMEDNVNALCKSRVCVISEVKGDEYRVKNMDGIGVLPYYRITDDMLKPFSNEVDRDTYNRWITEQYTKYTTEEKSLKTYSVHNGIIITEPRTGKSGCSYCHPDDKWDRKIGVAIAYARLKGEEIPTLEEPIISELKNGDFFKFSGNQRTLEFIGYCKSTDSYVVYDNGKYKEIRKDFKNRNIILV